MHVKTSKEVVDRQKASSFVHSVFDLQGPSISDALNERFGAPPGQGEDVLYLPIIATFAGKTKESEARLVERDEAHYAVKAKHTGLLRRRNQLVQRAGRRVVGLRQTVIGQHREADLGQLGFEDETAREPVPLLRQIDRIVSVFEGGQLTEILGEPVFADSPFEPEAYVRQLKGDGVALRGLVDETAHSQRLVEDAFLKKEAAMKEYDELFLRTSRIFEDCCRLAGRDDLADRIRPARRRPGRTEVEPPSEDPEVSAETVTETEG